MRLHATDVGQVVAQRALDRARQALEGIVDPDALRLDAGGVASGKRGTEADREAPGGDGRPGFQCGG